MALSDATVRHAKAYMLGDTDGLSLAAPPEGGKSWHFHYCWASVTACRLASNYSDLNDPRPIFDWMQIIRKRAVVYVGLDALSDAEVAAAVGNSMFSDLVSVAGHIYKHGIDDGLPGASANTKIPINLHADEFNELMGDEFIPMINKGGGAGVQVTAYTQTLSDIEARTKAVQVIGNFNNLFMLRVRETATVELLTNQYQWPHFLIKKCGRIQMNFK